MRIIAPDEWAGTKEELLAKIAQFERAKDAHRLTVGVPAPLPEAPIIEELLLTGATPVLKAELEVELPAGNVDAAVVERQRAIDYALNAMIVAAAGDKDAPDYVVNEAARISARRVP